jgi:transcription-repair coupling factor (superfamily II helicase)
MFSLCDGELPDVSSERVDRYGEPPGEVDNLTQLMSVKVVMRALERGPVTRKVLERQAFSCPS